MTTRTPECRCLNCGHKLNMAGSIESNDAPSPGCLCLCIRCGAVMMYAEDLTVRGMTTAEMDELCNDPEAMDFLAHQVRKIKMIPIMN